MSALSFQVGHASEAKDVALPALRRTGTKLESRLDLRPAGLPRDSEPTSSDLDANAEFPVLVDGITKETWSRLLAAGRITPLI